MKKLGIILMIVGGIWGIAAFNMDTTVDTSRFALDGSYQYIPGPRVHNIGKMDERRNHLLVAGLLVIVGAILLATDALKRNAANRPIDRKPEPESDELPPATVAKQSERQFPSSRSLESDEYQLYLVRNYKIEKNNALEKYVVNEKLFSAIDDALIFADVLDRQAEEADSCEKQRRDEEQRRRIDAEVQMRAIVAAKAAVDEKFVKEHLARRRAEQRQRMRRWTRYSIGVGAILVVAATLILTTHRWEEQTSILDDPDPFEVSRLDEMDRVDKTELPMWLQRVKQNAKHRRTWSKDTRTFLEKLEDDPSVIDRICRQPLQAQHYAKKAMTSGISAAAAEAQLQQFLAIYDDGPEYFTLLELKGVATAFWGVKGERAQNWCKERLAQKSVVLRKHIGYP